MAMKKSDVETSYHQFTRGQPMVNVKVYNFPHRSSDLRALAIQVTEGADDADLFADYVEQLYDADAIPEWTWTHAIEQGWEMLQTDAEEAFGPGVKVYSAGRSGGWCVVEGLPDVEDWDAIQLGKWARFCKWARQQADGIPYAQLWTLYANEWEPRRDELVSLTAEHGPIEGAADDD